MSSVAHRLVRCPKCRSILPELSGVPVYKCGGCGAILQAKKHKNEIKGNGSRAQETNLIHKFEPSYVLSSSSPEGNHPSIEFSPGSDTRSPEKHVDTNFSYEHCHSTTGAKLSPETNESAVQDECDEHLLDQDNGVLKDGSSDNSSEK